MEENKIVPVFAGVGEEDNVYYFKNTKVDFLKADIESYEFDMLLGAKNILKRDKPKLAIAIYHNAYDMYNILDWLDNLKLGYKFYIRQHSVRDTEKLLYVVCDD